jgi:DNA-directed RNA polymerase specialized sigma24 family protein
MSFPETRLTLIQRLAADGRAEDWEVFLGDYWGPVCRFALRSGAGQLSDAEDVASQTFEVLWESELLVRWVTHRTARLRSLLGSVTRKILANRHRVQAGRQRLAREVAELRPSAESVDDAQADLFYAAWVEDLLRQAVEFLAAAYYREGKGDYVRVLYGRLCQQRNMAELAQALDIKPAAVDNYFRHARQRLTNQFRRLVEQQIERFTPPDEVPAEMEAEWGQLGVYLEQHGGLEGAVRRAYELLDPSMAERNRQKGRTVARERLTSLIRGGSK